MERITRIHNIIRWQELYQARRKILAIYEGEEQKLAKLKAEQEIAENNKAKAQDLHNALTEKIEAESKKLDHILNQIEEMEKDRDNLKMARQIKSWEKDMEKYSQDREVIEAQLYYDRSKMGDITQECEQLTEQLNNSKKDIEDVTSVLEALKAQHKDKREEIEVSIKEISKQFDNHFTEYFNRLLLKNNGIVMSLIEEDSCSGCNVLLPTSFQGGHSILESEDSALPQCPNCFRYLYTEEMFNEF